MWNHLRPEAAAIDEVFAPLAEKATAFNGPWSVAELKLSDEDIEWLSDWFVTLPRDVTLNDGILLRRTLPREKLAALLIVLGAERCRKFAGEHSVWPILSKLVASGHPLWAELFLADGQPTFLTKLAIIEAAHSLKLRNSMGVEGTQQWFLTVKLQFGFTFKGAKRRLAEWLVGLGTPHAVQYLNGPLGPPELISRTFQHLWRTLRQYRREDISEEEARETLQESPWIKREWIDDLLIQARERIDTLGRSVEDLDAELVSAVGSPEERGPLESIQLSWPDRGCPRISFRLDREAITGECRSANCTELDFLVDGQWTGRWTRLPNGTWDGREIIYAERGSEPHQVNLAPKTLAVESGNGDLIQKWELADFGLLGDLLVFDLDDSRLLEFGVESLVQHKNYVLVCDRDYSIEGCAGIEVYDPPDSGRKAIRLPSPLTENLRISYEGFVIWQPVSPAIESRERIIAQLKILNDTITSVGDRAKLAVEGLPPQVTDVTLLIGKRTEVAERSIGCWSTCREVMISPELAMGLKVVRTRFLLNKNPITIMPRRALRLRGIATIVGDVRSSEAKPKLTLLSSGDPILKTAEGAQLRVWIPDVAPTTRAFEGHYFVGQVRHGRIRLKDFPGLGGTLAIRGFKSDIFENACVESGGIRDVISIGLDQPAHVCFNVKRQPDAHNHRFVAWVPHNDGRSELELLPSGALQTSQKSCDWRVIAPENMLALALTWQGAWSGAFWWLDRLSRCALQPSTSFFAAVRWLRLPVLKPEMSTWLGPLVLAKPFAFLEAWVQYRGLPEQLKRLYDEPAHDTIIRQFIGHWRPRQDTHCRQAIQILFGTELRTREQLLRSVDIVSRFSLPLLWWLASKLASEQGSLLSQAISTLLGLAAERYDRQMTRRLEDFKRTFADYCAFSADKIDELTTSVLRWLDHPATQLPPEQRNDLLLALGCEDARRYLAVTVLRHPAPDQGRML
ncbi:MAG: hypothetical protein A2W03_14415 [Candidatus Aminicenantes bacterium RBG_16_63_16]|nr:MAG: hypothetical protein A2W03_14415 [Candidatus Aminicenantes bacterium RBG_16_63_16]